MKRGTVLIGLWIVTLFAGTAHAANPVWTIDKDHSRVGFSVSHLGVSTVEGTFSLYDGEVTADESGRVTSVRATVQVKSIDTANDNRDASLRAPDFFDVAKYPTISMQTESAKWTGNRVAGKAKLTIKGTTRQIQYSGILTGKRTVEEGGRKVMRVGYTVTAKIKRSDFGLRFGGAAEAFGLVGETVNIKVTVEITRTL